MPFQVQGVLAIVYTTRAKEYWDFGRKSMENAVDYCCTFFDYEVTNAMGDRHGHLGRRHASNLVPYKFSLVSTICAFVCSSVTPTIDCRAAWCIRFIFRAHCIYTNAGDSQEVQLNH